LSHQGRGIAAPEGDVAALFHRASPMIGMACRCAEWMDHFLRRWLVAATASLAIAVTRGVVSFVSR
jgi:hypothetical protein